MNTHHTPIAPLLFMVPFFAVGIFLAVGLARTWSKGASVRTLGPR